MKRLFNIIDGLPKPWVIVASFLMVVLLGLVDHWTGPLWAFSAFDWFPVALAAWFIGLGWGLAVALTGAAVWLIADITGVSNYSHPMMPLWNTAARLTAFLVMAYALSALRRTLGSERHLARNDFLTDAANSRCFSEAAERAIEQAKRDGTRIALAYIDLDNFKGINDTFGHSVGDQLLKLVAEIIKKNSEMDFVLEIPSVVGSLQYYCKARNKKRIGDSDLSAAYVKGQFRKLPVLVLSPGELSTKAQEMLAKELNSVTFKKI